MIGTGLITQIMGDAFRRRSSQHHAIAGTPKSYAPGGTTSEGDIISGAVWPRGSSAVGRSDRARHRSSCVSRRMTVCKA